MGPQFKQDKDHNKRSHQFFQSQKLWSNKIPPADDFVGAYYGKIRIEYNKNVEMDKMMRLALDCVSAISSFMNPEFDYLVNKCDKLKAKVFWEAIKSISQVNIDIIEKNTNSVDKNISFPHYMKPTASFTAKLRKPN